MKRVSRVTVQNDYQLQVIFQDGLKGMVSIKDRLFGPMFEPLKDPDYFAKAQVDEFGAICWPNGADLAPDALYRRISDTANKS